MNTGRIFSNKFLERLKKNLISFFLNIRSNFDSFNMEYSQKSNFRQNLSFFTKSYAVNCVSKQKFLYIINNLNYSTSKLSVENFSVFPQKFNTYTFINYICDLSANAIYEQIFYLPKR